MGEKTKQSYLGGAALLAATVAIVKVIGFFYKIPLYNLLGDEGTTHFQVTYTIYNLLLTISTAGIPVALSRLISSARATGRTAQVDRLFSMGMATFVPVGLRGMGIMLLLPQQLANMMGDPEITLGIQALAPAVLFVCIVSVYRGYAQGFSYMTPTAASQIIEVVCKLVIGLAIAWILLRRGEDSATVSAGAIIGVTAGLAAAVPVMMIYKRRLDKRMRSGSGSHGKADGRGETAVQILKIGIPITLAASVMNIITLIDTRLVLSRLQTGAGFDYETAKVLYGVYSKGLSLFNLPAAFITPITVAVVPAIATAIARRDDRTARTTMESSLKVTNMLALPAGVGLAVLAHPIFTVLFPDSNENGPQLLMYLGIASYFVCTYLITNAILQANGNEKLSLLTLPLGGVIKVAVNWVLVGNPDIGIAGAPIGTLCCYIFITIANLIFINMKVKQRPSFVKSCVMPAICTIIMGAAAWASYGLISRAGEAILGSDRIFTVIYMVAAIGIAVVIYGIMIIVTGTVTTKDMELIPKGDKIGKLLHVRRAGKH